MYKRLSLICFGILLLTSCVSDPAYPQVSESQSRAILTAMAATETAMAPTPLGEPEPVPTLTSESLPTLTFTPVPPSTLEVSWPSAEWESAAPETLGIRSQSLLEFYQAIQENNLEVHSAVVVRHGYIAAEGYFYPFQPESTQRLYSCTKSVISALIGIAIEEGAIRSVDEKVIDFFPDYEAANLDDRKRALTLKHLLTMTSGFEWEEGAPYVNDNLGEMMRSSDWALYVLDRPMAYEPGEFFYYNSGNSHLLSAILEQATGKTTAEYAREKLFDPLGFPEVHWDEDPQGRAVGGWGLALTPREMAKFGYLYLRNGQWEGRQVVSPAWVADSTRVHVDPSSGVLSQFNYGYQWWILPELSPRAYSAVGRFGQWIIVVPEQDLVVVFASQVENFDLSGLVDRYLLPGVMDGPLPEDPTGEAALRAFLAEIAAPK